MNDIVYSALKINALGNNGMYSVAESEPGGSGGMGLDLALPLVFSN